MIAILFGITGNGWLVGGRDGRPIVLTFDSNIVFFSELIYLDAFCGQLLLPLSNQLFQLFFRIVQLWQHILDRPLAQHAANQPKAFTTVINSFQCIDDGSVNLEGKNLFNDRPNSWVFVSMRIYVARFVGYVHKHTYLCSFRSSSNVDILFTMFRCSFRNACNSASFCWFACASVAIVSG